MPQFPVEILEVQRSVTRPLVQEIVSRLLPLWGVAIKDTRISMFGETEVLPVTNSTLDPDPQLNRLFSDQKVEIEVEEDYSEHSGPRQLLYREDAVPIFRDDRVHVWMRPVYREMMVSVRLTIKSPDRTRMERLRRTLESRRSGMANYENHSAIYHYPIPDTCMALLFEIHALMEKENGYGESTGKWIKENMDPRFTPITNQGGGLPTFTIREQQIGIVGYMDFGYDIPPVEKQEQGHIHQIQMTYKFSYSRPDHVLIHYPMVIHNQQVPDGMIPKDRAATIERYYRQYGWTGRQLENLRYHRHDQDRWVGMDAIPIPYYDDWRGWLQPPHTTQIFRVQLQFDHNDPHGLLSLLDLGAWKLPQRVETYVKRRPQALTRLFDSVFHVIVYRWHTHVPNDWIVIDSNLNVTITEEPDIREVWHLTYSMVTDPTLISEDALRDLALDGLFARDYLNAIRPGLGDSLIINPDGTTSVNLIRNVIRGQGFTGGTPFQRNFDMLYGTIISHSGAPD